MLCTAMSFSTLCLLSEKCPIVARMDYRSDVSKCTTNAHMTVQRMRTQSDQPNTLRIRRSGTMHWTICTTDEKHRVCPRTTWTFATLMGKCPMPNKRARWTGSTRHRQKKKMKRFVYCCHANCCGKASRSNVWT